MTQSLYLDACIFVAFEQQKHTSHKIVKECVAKLNNFDINILSSEWALCEMCGVFVRDFGYSKQRAEKVANRYLEKKKIGEIKIKFINVDTIKNVGYKDFFRFLKEQMITNKQLHLADAIHSIIMSNNKIKTILTTDRDFGAIKNVTSIHPKVFAILEINKNN